uniref:Putative reverse transcriptase and intron maturase n=1 Tax=Neodangemannia microcystis TaxID=173495 RepID=A0A1W6EHG6_9CHLO|nr:putative reverse transcriptase and intron maturase [Neodangemannia microcystis]ARK14813.1 putative reverse transcriptase and intron maturase [Neodangemannia microcystis]
MYESTSSLNKNKGSTTVRIESNKKLMSNFGIDQAVKIAKKFRTNSYFFKSEIETSKVRSNNISAQENLIVQEAIRGILESIYEPEFEEHDKLCNHLSTNYGFRPHKSCHDAINTIFYINDTEYTRSQKTTWVIQSNFKEACNNINHQILIDYLSIRIKDKKFLTLIHDMLKCGILDYKTYEHSLTGTPQGGCTGSLYSPSRAHLCPGGIVSPLLFNIYMFAFDKYIYTNHICKVPEDDIPKYTSRVLKQTLKSYLFVRYAGNWIYLFRGSKKEAENIKVIISSFCKKNLKIELEPNKISITRFIDGFNFLGFSIQISFKPDFKRIKNIQKNKNNNITSVFTKQSTAPQISIVPDLKQISFKLLNEGFCKGSNLYPIGIRKWATLSEFDIVLKYRRIMISLYHYYAKTCTTITRLNRISYILQYSCAKTLANRKRITMPQVFRLYGENMEITIKIQTSKQTTKIRKTQFATLTELKKLYPVSRINRDWEKDPFNLEL